jgi:HK97 family phage major capsid protein
LSPKTLSAKAQYTRQLLAQSSLDVEYLIVQELARASAYKLQEAIINGSGSGAEPQGILGLSGTVTIPTGGIATNGGALTRSHLVDLEAALAAAGPAARPLQFLTNPKVRGAMKKTPVDTGSGLFVYDERDKNLLGYPTAVTNAVPSNLVKGTSGAVCSALILADWSELILANWGALDIKPWPKEDGIVTVQAMQLWDIGYKHTNSFGVIKDITT